MTPGSPSGNASLPDDSMLSPGAWLARNGVWVVFIVGVAGFLYYKFDLEGLLNIAKAALGLGFVVFIHELGHFAVAKWCDVHVETFSVGFGPALPGCSFQRGETNYKLAVLPLGGYVKMVGEGSENEEDEDNPRSFKNKTVGQRMAIISAGVVMNVILGCICFVAAYRSGVKEPAGIMGAVEPGSPAWKKGIGGGMVLQRIEDIEDPSFADMKYEVMLSNKGQELHLVMARPGESPQEIQIEPRREIYDSSPMLGVSPAWELTLWPEHSIRKLGIPLSTSAAAAARRIDPKPGYRIVATSVPEGTMAEEMKPLPAEPAPAPVRELARRMKQLVGKRLFVELEKVDAGAGESPNIKMELSEEGFLPGDSIVGMTDSSQASSSYDPFLTKELRRVQLPGRPQPVYDSFEFLQRMQILAARTIVIQVRRHGSDADAAPVSLLVPPAFHTTIGVHMRLGKIIALRDHSPAQDAEVHVADLIKAVEMTDGTSQKIRFVAGASRRPEEKLLDPLRLPFDMQEWANDRKNVKVKLTIARKEIEGQEEKTVTHDLALPWDSTRRFDQDFAMGTRSPVAIAGLGLAYQVETTIDEIAPQSPAAKGGLKSGDTIVAVRSKEYPKKDGNQDWGRWIELFDEPKGGPKQQAEPMWPYAFQILQDPFDRPVQVKVIQAGQKLEAVDVDSLASIELVPDIDDSWPSVDRGLRLDSAWRVRQVDSFWEALQLGSNTTVQSIVKVYMSLRSMLTGRVSATKNLSGPIGIATMAYDIAGEDWRTFLLFLGMISVNLAVVNFLPIPVLDGGHMVFLIYERLRGKPSSEQIRLVATYVGLFLILSLMVFVIWLDIKRRW